MSNREDFLRAVRCALGKKVVADGTIDSRAAAPFDPGFPPIPAEQLAERFEKEAQATGCRTWRAASSAELARILAEILDGAKARDLVLSRNPLLGELRVQRLLEQQGRNVFAWPTEASQVSEQTVFQSFRSEAFKVGAGITGVDFALAESGTLVLTSSTEGSQLASLAPPVHIVLYRRAQLRGSLEEVLTNLPVAREPERTSVGRSVVFVTGPSRTADIEQILVRGVHGPGEVHAILTEV